ncbi:MAG: hypothetical protein QOI12_4366 [Alphaproteobacteria bacterium]|jgi:hypothetical protein|nr:hypothetical protein [Alphaproteobacteria bacterium]
MARISLASPDTSKQTRLRQVVPQGPDKKEIAVGRCFPPATAPQGRWVLTARTRETAESSGAVQNFFVPLAFAHDPANVQVIQKVNSGQVFLSRRYVSEPTLSGPRGTLRSPNVPKMRRTSCCQSDSAMRAVRCVSPVFPARRKRREGSACGGVSTSGKARPPGAQANGSSHRQTAGAVPVVVIPHFVCAAPFVRCLSRMCAKLQQSQVVYSCVPESVWLIVHTLPRMPNIALNP